jgi:PAS domain S-box-containing protein
MGITLPEQQVRESEARLAAILKQLPIGVGLFDRNLQLVDRGGLLSDMWGRVIPSRDVTQSKQWRSFDVDGRVRQPADYPGERALRGETVLPGIDFVHTADDGRETWIRVSASPFYNAAGKIEGVVSLMQNIDEEKRAEQRLRESEARLSAIVNQFPGAIGLFDQEGRLLLRGGFLNGLWDNLIPSRDPASVRRWRGFDANGRVLPFSEYPGARALRGETVSPGVDFIHTAADGRENWIRFSAGPFRNGAGEFVGAVAIMEGVDDEKRAEQRLRKSEARLQAAVDLLKLGCYSWNPQTNELEWDATLKAMWGLPPYAPVDYDTWRAAVHPDDLARVEAAIAKCIDPRLDGIYDIEYRVIGINDGVERWIATRGQTLFENDKPVSFYGVALDVTARKHIESALERRVETRTRELEEANRQLRSQIEQRRTAEYAVQQLQRLDAVGQITSGVAHDFNNLLSVVLANADLLSRKVRDPDDQEGVELITAAAERGAKLTAQLLAFSRTQRLEPRAVDLNDKIGGMIELLGVTLGGTVRLKTMLEPHLWTAFADPMQIELVILNLAINARDAMPSGGSLVIETFNTIIETEPLRPEEPSPGEYVGLAVNDTGVGIPDQVLPHVFEPFFTTKEPGKGSGLGLSQVYGFAKQSGGGARIETRVGQGTSVKVYLPRVDVVLAAQERELVEPQQRPQTTRNVRVLVVDDEKPVLRSTVKLLSSLGCAAVQAESGSEAFRMIASGLDVDLVLADFAMPGMNGAELAKALRAARPALPVILVTGYGNLDLIKEFGDSRILEKPFTRDDLVEAFTRALK